MFSSIFSNSIILIFGIWKLYNKIPLFLSSCDWWFRMIYHAHLPAFSPASIGIWVYQIIIIIIIIQSTPAFGELNYAQEIFRKL